MSRRFLRNGFTLIEALITIAVLAVLGSVVSGFYSNYIKSLDLDNASKIIIAELRSARANAVAGKDSDNNGTSDDWGVCFRNPLGTGTGKEDVYEVVSPTSTCIAGSSSVVKNTIYLPNGVTFSTPGDNAVVSVVFNKINGTVDTNKTVTIANSSGSTKTITINSSGLIE